MSEHKLVRAWAAGEILTLTSPADRHALKQLVDDYDKLKQMRAVAEEALDRLTKVGPPSVPTTGAEWANVCLTDNCKIAREAQAEIKKLRG